MIINQQNVVVHFRMTHVFQQQFLYCFTWSNNQFIFLNIFSFLFLQTFLLISSISLCFDYWIFCCLLANLFPIVWLFLVLFWMLWILVTVHKPCHVPPASRITTWGKMFKKIFLGMSKEWLRSRSHSSLITNLKTLAKKILEVRPEHWTRRKKEKKTKMTIAELFPLNANAKSSEGLMVGSYLRTVEQGLHWEHSHGGVW